MIDLVGPIVGAFTILIGMPLHFLVTLFIKICDHGPVFFCSSRLGKNGKPFLLFKYRTMAVDSEPLVTNSFKTIVVERDPRVTWVGKWLRCGIDELPQIWNVIRGEMAWVGPRPDEEWMLPNYGPVCRKRLSVAAGITGLAQVLNSRNLSTAEAYAIDLWYITHRSVCMDAWIVLVTPFFIAGWRSLGAGRLEKLRRSPVFRYLVDSCEAELSRSSLGNSRSNVSV